MADAIVSPHGEKRCKKCGRSDFYESGPCRFCTKELRKALTQRNKPCGKCGGLNRYPSGRCRDCQTVSLDKIKAKRALAEGQADPCAKCGSADLGTDGRCRSCSRIRCQARRDRLRQEPAVWAAELARTQAAYRKKRASGQATCGRCGGDDFFPSGHCRPCVTQDARKRHFQLKAENPEVLAKRAAKSWQKRRLIDRHLVHSRMSSAVASSLNRYAKNGKANSSWTKLCGYSVEELMAHLKKTLPAGRAWQDYLDGKLHIDHKIPVSAFNFHSPQCHDFQRCWSLSNLQLLPGPENMNKGAKLLQPFQPSLL